ncbi:MAG: hypothetical protein ACO3EE_07210, partial [Flavobacteriales bacterium]
MFFFSANARTIDLQKVEDDSLLMHADLSYFEDVSATLFFEKIQHQTFEEGKTQFRSVQNVESAYWVKLNFKDDSLRKFIL